MSLERVAGIAALVCAATYVAGFALLVTLLAPLGYGTAEIDPGAVVEFIDTNPAIMIVWNMTIYVVNALALTILVMGVRSRLIGYAPGWADVTTGFGLIWSALVLGAGMIAIVAVEQSSRLFSADPQAAADLWNTLHMVELGLGGGNEIAGGVWILTVSLGGFASNALNRSTCWLGLIVATSGLATVIPPLGDIAGAIFGLGAIIWFIAAGISLMKTPTRFGA